MVIILEKYEWKRAILSGFMLWVFAFFFAWGVMAALGIDQEELEEEPFGPDYDEYLPFEMILIPSFIIIGLIAYYWYFSSSEINHEEWITEALLVGVTVMVIQFVLDTIFLVIIFDSGIEYFFALVTISYLLVPVWSLLVGYYVREYRASA